MGTPPLTSLLLLLFVVPMLSYFTGIWLRYYTFREDDDMALRKQFALGIPTSLATVVPLSLGLSKAVDGLLAGANPGDASAFVGCAAAYLVTIGIAIEHGMIVQETVRKRLKKLIGSDGGDDQIPANPQ
jgi:hypothetical protein